MKKKEIYVMPENVKDVDWYGSKRLHRMYVDVKDGVKTMMYRPRDKRKEPCELPSVSVKVAAKQVVKFMKEVGSNTMLSHGKDMITMDNFMLKYGNWKKWKDVRKNSVDTQVFFKKVQEELSERKYKMVVVTEMHGWPALQKMYEEGQHGALTDAYVLAQLCCGTKSSQRIRFGEWLAGR